MKHGLFLILLCICFRLYSQELSLGGGIGYGHTSDNYSKTFVIGGSMEYRPKKAIFSINMDPFILIYKDKIQFTDPLYLKIIFDNTFRFGPTFGLFITPMERYGWTIGLDYEYKCKKNLIIFLKADHYEGYSKEDRLSPGGSPYQTTVHSNYLLISGGIKKFLFNKTI
jgi:hypothetical protein